MSLEFDYIVVGGGAAGCVLAGQLAADGQSSVALIEAGRKDTSPWIHIPATFFKALESEDAEILTSDADATLGGRPHVVPIGHVLGGGSSINAMIYMRGQAQDYDDWANQHGCTGWAYQDVLPVFIQQEANQDINDEYHGNTGLLKVSNASHKHPVTAATIASAQSLGIAANNDFNGASQGGVGWYQSTKNDGRRASSAVSFLKPVLDQDNLSIFTQHQAQRIIFNGKKAVAVEVLHKGQLRTLKAQREIVLSAGSFHTPQLLMLSGIGPKQHLNQFSINTIFDAPEVGANLIDHVGAPVTMRLQGSYGLHGADKGWRGAKHMLEYLLMRQGLLASNLLEGGACIDTNGMGRPDVQFNFAPFAPGFPGTPPLPFHAVQIHPMTMRPKSAGRIYLQSNNIAQRLGIESQVLAHADDLACLRRGVKLAREMFTQAPLRDLVTQEIWPGSSLSPKATDDELDQAIRQQARTIFHPAGTCRMGGDIRAVVDAKLRVNGVENLRIADCSVMPRIISGNTNAPTMMIAQRAAQWMLADR
jgi:choline dehydrogenase-like flavoprotein